MLEEKLVQFSKCISQKENLIQNLKDQNCLLSEQVTSTNSTVDKLMKRYVGMTNSHHSNIQLTSEAKHKKHLLDDHFKSGRF